MGLRDTILGKMDLKEEKVFVPEWGVEVIVRELTGIQRSRLIDEIQKDQLQGADLNSLELYTTLIIQSVVDPETGEFVFTPEDKQALSEKSGSAMETIAKVALKLSALNPENKLGKPSS